ncbi:alpha-amylase family glycosyl hydrolase [Ammonicoccus fulvus]|uniref:Alpha-amylase family glycosyl hydrolase n=1 Tax=Ammonicoccus fulvus TaxID=3138240 RepID=A0ABZ3FUL1_9ACTN
MLEHAIWWHVYPLGACGAPIRGERDAAGQEAHRLRRLLPWLDHVVRLGANGLLLGPIFQSTTHGYDTVDHHRIDSRLGTEADFDDLVAAASERGIAVMLDGVFNHVSREHPIVREHPEMIAWRDGHPLGWEGNFDLVQLDHSKPAVADLVVDVMTHWLERGIAGWRLDAAYSVPTWFWARVSERVRERFPDAILLGEMIHGDYAEFARDGGLTTITQYELWKALWSSILDTNAWELAHAIERHDAYAATFIPQTFVGNHDVTRIATRVGHDGAALALAALMTLPGSPSIYYGDELGWTGTKYERAGGDDEVRVALPELPDECHSPVFEMHQRVIGWRRRHAWVATGRVSVLEKTDSTLAWEVTNGDQSVRVDVDLAARRLVAGGDDTLHVG